MTGRRLAVRTTEVEDPGALTHHVWGPDTLLFSHRGDGLVAAGCVARIEVDESDRFAVAERRLSEVLAAATVHDEVGVPGTGPVAFGAFTFDPRVRGSVIIVPRVVIGRREGRFWRTTIDDGTGSEPAPTGTAGRPVRAELPGAPADPTSAGPSDGRVRYQGSTMSEVGWLTAVDRAVEELRAGHTRKVVLARDRRVWSRRPFDVGRLVTHLAARFPSCQTFSVDGLIGASPEVLVDRRRRQVHSLVLAGTAPRGGDAGTDADHATRLLGSDKDRREHALAVDSIRAALDPVAKELEVDARPHVLRLANVMHLATTVRATMDDPASALSLAGRLHPSAAVCGTPTAEALEMIRRLEGMDRARYSGPVGWVDGSGDGQWAIALRCAEIDGTRGRLFAGAGIVDGSLPEAELEETRLKLRAMQSAFEA